MTKFLIPLEHILIDPANPVDLTALPEEDAVRIIRCAYVFVSESVDVSIRDGIAIIEFADDIDKSRKEAEKLFKKGIREAQGENYRKAIKEFSKVLELYPAHVDARRNLAMAYLEEGAVAKAKGHLQECLKIDPSNAWSFVLLGNIYAKRENNKKVAEFYYEAGLSVSPDDHILLNNYAALQMEFGNFTKAKMLFEKALIADSSYPNSYYGLALLHQINNNLPEALALLDKLFDQSKSDDIRSAQVYGNARALYLEVSETMARRDCNILMEFIISKKSDLERATGYTISVEQDNTLEYVYATAQLAWKHSREEHRIRYRIKDESVTPHLVAHEMEHILLEHEAREVGKNLFFTTTAETRVFAIHSIEKHIEKIQKQGYTEKGVEDVILKLIHGLCNQVFNCPIDMVVEYNIFKKYPELRKSQLASLHKMYLDGLHGFKSPDIKNFTPPTIYKASNTLNCSFAFFLDHLYQGRTDYASAYRSSEIYRIGENLFNIWKKSIADFHPGDEYELVDKFARLLKLQPWYVWKEDDGKRSHSNVSQEEPAQPLTTENPEAFSYCLDSLKRFEGKSGDEIFSVVSELSILGMGGIDHSTSDKKYQLKAYPNETFSGLHILALPQNLWVDFRTWRPVQLPG